MEDHTEKLRALIKKQPHLKKFGFHGLWSVTPAMVTPPGVGKSAMTEWVASECDAWFMPFIGSQRQPSDVGGIPVIEDGEIKLKLIGLMREAVEIAKSGRPVVVLIDELTSVPPAMQNPLLSVLTSHRMGDTDLPPNLALITAMNPSSQVLHGFGIGPAMNNRLVWYTLSVDAAYTRAWVRDFPALWGNPLKQDFGRIFWRTKIAQFIQNQPGHLHAMPLATSWVGNPWPSPRSWEMASDLLAFMYDATASDFDWQDVAPAIGETSARAFGQWLHTANTITAEQWMAKGMPLDALPKEWGSMLTVVTETARIILGDPAKHKTEWIPFWNMLVAMSADHADIVEMIVRDSGGMTIKAMKAASAAGLQSPIAQLTALREKKI